MMNSGLSSEEDADQIYDAWLTIGTHYQSTSSFWLCARGPEDVAPPGCLTVCEPSLAESVFMDLQAIHRDEKDISHASFEGDEEYLDRSINRLCSQIARVRMSDGRHRSTSALINSSENHALKDELCNVLDVLEQRGKDKDNAKQWAQLLASIVSTRNVDRVSDFEEICKTIDDVLCVLDVEAALDHLQIAGLSLPEVSTQNMQALYEKLGGLHIEEGSIVGRLSKDIATELSDLLAKMDI